MTWFAEPLSHFPLIFMTSRTYLTTLATVLLKQKNCVGSSLKFALDNLLHKSLIQTYFDSSFTSFLIFRKLCWQKNNFSVRSRNLFLVFRVKAGSKTTTVKRHWSIKTQGGSNAHMLLYLRHSENPMSNCIANKICKFVLLLLLLVIIRLID